MLQRRTPITPWPKLALLLVLGVLPFAAAAQTLSIPDNPTGPELPANTNPTEPSPTNSAPTTPPTNSPPLSQDPAATLSQSNRELLDLLKKQQSVLEDMQYDRRLLNRRVQLLEEKLEDKLQENAQLQAQIAKLQAEAADRLANPPPAPAATATTNSAPATAATPPPTPPASPNTYLPLPDPPAPPGTESWHRLFTLSGTDTQTSDPFHVQGHQWRVVWHNQDPAGDKFKNTSALFINAFPTDAALPQKVCAKAGSGGDSTILTGPGSFSLKIEASGGNWELAVEDYY